MSKATMAVTPYPKASRCMTPRMRIWSIGKGSCWKQRMESQLMPIPIRKMITVRLRIFKPAGTLKVKLYFLKEMYVEIPIMNIKNGTGSSSWSITKINS